MMHRIRNRKEAGQALVLTVTGLVALTAIVGLAIDAGVMRYEKRLQQTAADAAAVAAAQNIPFNSGIQAAGYDAAITNGYTDSGGHTIDNCAASVAIGTVCVEVNHPPKFGPHATNSAYAEARIARVNPTYFMKVLGINSSTFTARAVATNVSGGTDNGCMYTLGQPTKKIAGLSTSGSVKVVAPTCGIIDNGNFDANGGAQLEITAGSIGVAGDYNGPNGPNATVTPTPVTSMPTVGDPLADRNLTPPAHNCNGAPDLTLQTGQTAVPGTYNDIKINANANVTFKSGTYTVCGTFSDRGNSQISGTEVTFYIAAPNGTVILNGDSQVNLSAPTSGDYTGILFYQDPADANGATVNGNNLSSYTGTLYFPAADLNFGGTSGSTFNAGATYTLIIANSLTLAGNPTIVLNSDYSGLPNGQSIIKHAILVE